MSQTTLSRRTQLTTALGVGVLGLAGAIAWGPLLPWTVERVRAEPGAGSAPARLYLCARAQRALQRGSRARETLELWLQLYAQEQGRDWGPLLSGETEWRYSKYDMGEGIHERGFAPWLEGGPKPGPLAPVSDELLGRALLDYVELLEDDKDYPKAAHVVVCLLHLWPEESEVHRQAVEAFMRSRTGRTF